MGKRRISNTLSSVPVRLGAIFCAPFCGGNCKYKDYRKAVKASNKLAEELGLGWKGEVSENLGWHWKVQKAQISLHPRSNKSFWGSFNSSTQIIADGNSAKHTLEILRKKVLSHTRKMSLHLKQSFT